ncbi:MAG: HEAT repeat domain-containing protein [Phycisphaeraceae bacterium]|nr:HEAT repeat domain-containing protein [Phycisphaeraceae bacterium]
MIRCAPLVLVALVVGVLGAVGKTAAAGGENGEHACHEAKSAAVQASIAFDPASGRSLLNYPPDPLVAYERMTLHVVIPDMNVKRLDAACTLRFSPVGEALARLPLRAGPPESMAIRSVMLEEPSGTAVEFAHTGESLDLRFSPPIPAGRGVRLVVVYSLIAPAEGLVWTPESSTWPGRPAQLHSQGQPESNHYWFPCHDFPNVRMSTEMFVTVPSGFVACSNGRLVSEGAFEASALPEGLQPVAGGLASNLRTFHWLQSQPHVPYLVSLVVGKFDVVDVSDTAMPMPVYAPLGKGDQIQQTYGRTPEMVRLFERRTSQPYPWDKYAQVIVHNFGAGGMENTSATTMYDTAILDSVALLDGDLDGLISHELAHQWFGDLLTCNSWEHIWLNEGFATYFSHLWFEHRDGIDAYQAGVWANMHSVIGVDHAEAPEQAAMCSRVYTHPWETFRRAANPYSKGASVLHMLRRQLGDEAFFRGLSLYVARSRGSTVETADLRKAMEAASGLGLQQFFEQWCFRPGVPVVTVGATWEESTGTLRLSLEQTQPIDGWNPAFDIEVPFFVRLPGEGSGRVHTARLRTADRAASLDLKLDSAPEFVATDPDMDVMADWKISQPAVCWLKQLKGGPSLASKLQALDALRTLGPNAAPLGTIEAIAEIAGNTATYHSLRTAAVRALGQLKAWDQLAALAGGWPSDARVRRTIVEELASLGRGDPEGAIGRQVATILESRLRGDPSYGVRSAAVAGLGSMRVLDALPLVIDAAAVESQDDQIRQAALDALGAMDRAEGYAAALRYCAPGTLSRTRPTAIRTLAALGHHDPDQTLRVLADLLRDDEQRSARAAGEGIATLGDPRGVEILEAFIASASSEVARFDAGRALSDLRAKVHATEKPGHATPPAEPALEPAPAARSTPAAPRDRRVRWIRFPIAATFAKGPEAEESLAADPAAFFLGQDLIVERSGGELYLLCFDDAARSMDSGTGEWGVIQAAVVPADAAEKSEAGVGVDFDARGAAMFGVLTKENIGRRLAIASGGDVVAVPVVRTTMSNRAMITGTMSGDELGVLALKIGRDANLSLRITPRPGELEDEAELRTTIRERGPGQ